MADLTPLARDLYERSKLDDEMIVGSEIRAALGEQRDEIERLRGKGTWSGNWPTEKGWYWWRTYNDQCPVEVFSSLATCFVVIRGETIAAEELGGEFHSIRINEPE